MKIAVIKKDGVETISTMVPANFRIIKQLDSCSNFFMMYKLFENDHLTIDQSLILIRDLNVKLRSMKLQPWNVESNLNNFQN